jgi:hypothetical protein
MQGLDARGCTTRGIHCALRHYPDGRGGLNTGTELVRSPYVERLAIEAKIARQMLKEGGLEEILNRLLHILIESWKPRICGGEPTDRDDMILQKPTFVRTAIML